MEKRKMAIPKMMKALVAYAPKDYRIEEVSVPQLDEGEILIKVEACGICAGDIKAYNGAPSFWGDSENEPYMKTPVIPGHEFIGTVAMLGTNVKGNFQIGDRVISEQIVPCWECRFCKTGHYSLCQKNDVYGFKNYLNGGLAEYMKYSKRALNYQVQKDIPIEKAILIEPYACAKHCADRAQIGNNDVVVLSGAGPLGLGITGAVKLKKPRILIVLDIIDERLQIAKEFGADIVMNPTKEDVVKKIMLITDGYGCDKYIEAAGNPKSVHQGLAAIRKMGTFVEFSVFKEETSVDWSIIGDRKELDIYGSHISPYCYESVIEWIGNGKMPTKGVVTHKYPLEEWKQAFDIAEKGVGALKVILTF